MKSKSVWIILGIVTFFGCDSPKLSIVVPATSLAAESLPKIAHPEYVNWSQFAEKSFVVRKRTISNSGGAVVVTTKMWLDKKDSNAVSVGSQVTVERPNEPAVENGDDFVKYPATFGLPIGMDEKKFYLPSAKAKETGKEVVTVGEKSVEATVYEWEESNETGPMTVKLWRSEAMPGKIVRQEFFTKSTETKTLEEVIDFELR